MMKGFSDRPDADYYEMCGLKGVFGIAAHGVPRRRTSSPNWPRPTAGVFGMRPADAVSRAEGYRRSWRCAGVSASAPAGAETPQAEFLQYGMGEDYRQESSARS